MEALDNPSYFKLGDDPNELCSGGPRTRDIAPEQRKCWLRRSSDSHQLNDTTSSSSPGGGVVMLGSSSARYYNVGSTGSVNTVSSTTSSTMSMSRSGSVKNNSIYGTTVGGGGGGNPRRHSFSATLHRSRSINGKKMYSLLDITIVSSRSSEAASLWVNYLTSCFQQISKEEHKPPFKLAKVWVEDVVSGLSVEGASGSRLQIVIVCPAFLNVLSSSPGVPILASMLQPATVLAMLLGVSHQTLDSHPLSNLFRFEQWRKYTVKDQDATFVGDFLGVAMDVLSRSWQMQQAMAQIKNDHNRAFFSITPKKIKVGQNKLLILLNDPTHESDKVTITVEKNGTKMEIQSVKRRNPYTFQFSMPSSCLQTSMLVNVFVERNGRPLGHKVVKCESKLRELDQLLRSTDNPLVFMCQALGITSGDKEHLDNFLASAFRKNLPPNFNLLNATNSHDMLLGKEEFPTLLHFAARYGLEKLCWQLLDCPGGESACQMKNSTQNTPADIAEHSGHATLAHALHGYLQMTELSSMYSYVKKVTEKPQDFGDGNYLLPRPITDTYLVPPKARPIFPLNAPSSPASTPQSPTVLTPGSPVDFFQVPPLPPTTRAPSTHGGFALDSPSHRSKTPGPFNANYSVPCSPMETYQSPPHARPFTPHTPPTPTSPVDPMNKFSAYLQMHSPVSDRGSHNNYDHILGPEKKYVGAHPGPQNLSIGGHNYMNTGSSTSVNSKNPEDDLLEIINDFKNNVFSISEVEELVEAWRNRNDVQQSFKEKQEQLHQMRQEYERIQQMMKDKMKRATPFEKIKKFFSRKPKNDFGPKGKTTSDQMSNRPVSSLSLHSSCSSSSSGRMSTASGASLGDSGTHSDPEEKKSEVSDKSSPTHDSVFLESRLYSVKEHSDSTTSFQDEYVRASPPPYSPAIKYPTLPCPPPVQLSPPPPPLPGRIVAEVHRSAEILPEETKENQVEVVETEADREELLLLEKSEQVLKNMAENLPCFNSKDDNDIDALSPPESAFTGDGCYMNIEVEPEDKPSAKEVEGIVSSDRTANQTKDVPSNDDSNDETVPLMIEYSNVVETASNVGATTATQTDDHVLNFSTLCDLAQERSQLVREYVNVKFYPPPVVPHKYKNVLL